MYMYATVYCGKCIRASIRQNVRNNKSNFFKAKTSLRKEHCCQLAQKE